MDRTASTRRPRSVTATTARWRIRAYLPQLARFQPYEPAIEKAAKLLRDAIRRVEPRLRVEHIGSTSIPGCGGKGILDLAILYPGGLLADARHVLDGLGFQKQGGPEPFPEDRPMRVCRLEHGARSCLVHAHVIARACREHRELVWFRDLLRRRPALRRRYEERKRAILAMGIRDSVEYCKAKGPFIAEVLNGTTHHPQPAARTGSRPKKLSNAARASRRRPAVARSSSRRDRRKT